MRSTTPIANCLGQSVCPKGIISCNNNPASKYCYYPNNNMMVSTYMLSLYDYYPFDRTGNSEGGRPYYIDGVPLWYRTSGKGYGCSNL
jgi:hypothetical protein